MDFPSEKMKKEITEAIIKESNITESFLEKYARECDVNFYVDINELLENFTTDINSFMDDNIYGIKYYKEELEEEL